MKRTLQDGHDQGSGRANFRQVCRSTGHHHRRSGCSARFSLTTRGISGRSAYGPKCRYRHFGPFFLKFCSYFPFNAKLCINGNEWAKRQAAKAGIGFTPLDNAFAAVDDVPALQAICHALGPAQIDALPHRDLPAGHHLARPWPPPSSRADQAVHERWEIETAYLELKSTILGGRVLRARTPAGIDQEIYALLVTYKLLRTAMADATTTVPGTDPDRASFTIALHTARDQLTCAADIIAGTVIDLAGTIGRHVLTGLLPARRQRGSPRIVKRAISKYQARGPDIDRASYNATLSIDILIPPAALTAGTSPSLHGLATSPGGPAHRWCRRTVPPLPPPRRPAPAGPRPRRQRGRNRGGPGSGRTCVRRHGG